MKVIVYKIQLGALSFYHPSRQVTYKIFFDVFVCFSAIVVSLHLSHLYANFPIKEEHHMQTSHFSFLLSLFLFFQNQTLNSQFAGFALHALHVARRAAVHNNPNRFLRLLVHGLLSHNPT